MNPENFREPKPEWKNYYERTRNTHIPKVVLEAVGFVTNKNKAIDLGAGALRDTEFFIDQGFQVTALDSSPLLSKEAERFDKEKITVVQSTLENFDFPEKEYDMVSAILSLLFVRPDMFNEVIEKIKKSLKKDGIFCATFVGNNDDKTLGYGFGHTKEEVQLLLSDMEIISLKEQEGEGRLVSGTTKYSHRFDVIAKKL